MPWLRERWTHFWFAPEEPTNLGVCRLLFFGAMFLYYLPVDFSAWGEVSRVFWKPTWLFRFFALPAFSPETLSVLQIVWKGSLLFACAGLLTRSSTLAAFILGTYLLGLPQNFGKIRHSDAILVFVMASLALSHCGAGWSVDRLISQWRRPGASPPYPAVSGEYTWPVRIVWLVMALVFFAAGVAKIRHGGLEWITSDTLAIMLVDAHYQVGRIDPTVLGLYLAQYSWLCHALAALTIILETSFPLALVSRWARRFLAPAVLGLQIGIRICLGPSFEQYLFCYVFWVPWATMIRGGKES